MMINAMNMMSNARFDKRFKMSFDRVLDTEQLRQIDAWRGG